GRARVVVSNRRRNRGQTGSRLVNQGGIQGGRVTAEKVIHNDLFDTVATLGRLPANGLLTSCRLNVLSQQRVVDVGFLDSGVFRRLQRHAGRRGNAGNVDRHTLLRQIVVVANVREWAQS